MIPIIERHIDSKFSAGEEQPFALRILANCAQKSRRRNTIGDCLPGRAIVAGSIDVWRLIIEPAAIDGRVSDSRVEMRSFDQRDLAPVADLGRSNVLPGFPTIARNVNHAGVAPRPDQVTVEGRWSNGSDYSETSLLRVPDGWCPFCLLALWNCD